MATTRAKRLNKYLQNLGWETGGGTKWTCSCGYFSLTKHNFCKDCGKKMQMKYDPADDGNTVLEAAIAYALNEK